MDKYDYAITDKQMSGKLNDIYNNPKRHRFYSLYKNYITMDEKGPRGGRVIGRKTICTYCGCKKREHVEVDEQI